MKNFMISLPPAPLQASLFDADESGSTYRQRTFGELGKRYRPHIDSAIELLRADFEYDSLSDINRVQLRRGLIQRQALPFLIGLDALAPNRDFDVRILAGCIGAHTLALTQLDYHLDGALPSRESSATAVWVSDISAVSYAVREIYRASAIMASSSVAPRIFKEVLDPISGFVIARMHEDWLYRYNIEELDRLESSAAVDQILHSDRSRMLASGYWEVMLRAAFICARPRDPIPDALQDLSKALRRIRQLVDELDDLADDLASGLVTLPLALAVNERTDGWLLSSVRRLWTSPKPTNRAAAEGLANMVLTPSVLDALAATYAELDAAFRTSCASLQPEVVGVLEILVDIKRAKFVDLLAIHGRRLRASDAVTAPVSG